MRFVIAIFIVSFLLSCKKAELNYVKGTVYDNATGEPVKNIMVYLYEDHYKKSGHYFDSTLTDEKGEYHIDFSKKAGKRYYVSYKCDNKYFDSVTPFDKELEHGRNAVNFSIQPSSYILFRFIKTSNSANWCWGGTGDRFETFASPLPKIPAWPACIYSPFDLTLSYAETIRGEKNITIKWDVVPSDTTYVGYNLSYDTCPYSYTFYAKKGDTLKYTITFN
jgi:hypothetical protein